LRSLRNDVCIEWTTIAVSPPPAKSDWTPRFGSAARAIANEGKFASLAGTMANAELNAFFRDDMKKRTK